MGIEMEMEEVDVSRLSGEELLKLFEERKRMLIAVRDEIDRRERPDGKPSVDVDFTQYVGDGIEG